MVSTDDVFSLARINYGSCLSVVYIENKLVGPVANSKILYFS